MRTANAERQIESDGGIGKVLVRRISRPVHIDTGPRRWPSACFEKLNVNPRFCRCRWTCAAERCRRGGEGEGLLTLFTISYTFAKPPPEIAFFGNKKVTMTPDSAADREDSFAAKVCRVI